MEVVPLRTFHTDPHSDPAVKPTYFSNVNVPFSHFSEGKAQKNGRKARSDDELPLTLGFPPIRPDSRPVRATTNPGGAAGRPLFIFSGLGLLRRRR